MPRSVRRRSPAGLFAITALLSSTVAGAWAQVAATPAKVADTVVSEIVVTGERPAAKSSIDRRTYTVSRDLQGATGSVSDVLANLPSVDVDLEGNIKLRGDSSVQILIDGKPSALVNGSNRAMALQQMPASTVETVEIMTNPSAEFAPDGTAGIINIVTKKVRSDTRSGSMKVRAASEGRLNAGLQGSYKAGRLSLSGNFDVTADDSTAVTRLERTQIDPTTSDERRSTRNGDIESARRGWGGALGVDYDITPRDRVGLSLNHYKNPTTTVDTRTFTSKVRGVTVIDYDRVGRGSREHESSDISANYRHAFAERERDFRINLRYAEISQGGPTLFTNTYRAPTASSRQEERISRTDDSFLSLSADYVQPTTNGRFRSGYAFRDSNSDNDVYGGLIDPVTGVSTPMPNVTNRFVASDAIHALYATHQQQMGKWSALGGLRLEHTVTDTDLVTTGQADHSQYTRLYPSLHLQYDLTEFQKLKASYSHRVARPGVFELNPFVFFADEFNASTGNPRLKPQDTHSIELGWEHQKGGRSVLATAYLRRNYNAFASVRRLISPTQVLSTLENLGENTSGGIELAATGKMSPKLSYNVGANLFYNELRGAGVDSGHRSAVGHSAKGRFDYRLTPNDLFQITASHTGRRLRNQGYSPSTSTVNFGYQHKFRPDLSLVITVSDAFKSALSASVLETPGIYEVSEQRGLGRTFSFAITKQFGGRRSSEPEIEYINP